MLEDKKKEDKKDLPENVYVKFDSLGKVLQIFVTNIPEGMILKGKNIHGNGYIYFVSGEKAVMNDNQFMAMKNSAVEFNLTTFLSDPGTIIKVISDIPLKIIKPEFIQLAIDRMSYLEIPENKRKDLIYKLENANIRNYFVIENYLLRNF